MQLSVTFVAARPWSPAGESSSDYRARVCRDGGAQCRHRHSNVVHSARFRNRSARLPRKVFQWRPDRDARGGQEMKPRW
ncbi:DUF2749 domain-containing protein [Brucella intermedia]|uniref:DUF2749 domain-containing protein n=1 Tax=Brucella intermedia TaxID=94625 RepID=UPI00396A5812